jgi:hypothetical protein
MYFHLNQRIKKTGIFSEVITKNSGQMILSKTQNHKAKSLNTRKTLYCLGFSSRR